MATYTIEGNTVSYSGAQVTGVGSQIKMRGTIIFAPDFMSYVEKRERSIDGKEWMPVAEAKATKVKSSAK